MLLDGRDSWQDIPSQVIVGDISFSSLADSSLVLYVAREEQLLWDVASIGHVHKVSCLPGQCEEQDGGSRRPGQ